MLVKLQNAAVAIIKSFEGIEKPIFVVAEDISHMVGLVNYLVDLELDYIVWILGRLAVFFVEMDDLSVELVCFQDLYVVSEFNMLAVYSDGSAYVGFEIERLDVVFERTEYSARRIYRKHF